ncbi:hypothetical protein [Bdellovibrio svalbardensis]|uniref:Lipoprotein n=1 Tax=Bdellovibrio svalbardensis TaxID=2972972 RepID=A0ABT6DHY1_9BACT|nr:hypothetical protein [Bdellovibrio svalbardensis]MDG0816460.1 hypothetical protein [Bdellovibrio svalbardensis]
MQKIVAIVMMIVVGGCVSIPKESVLKPTSNPTKYCVAVDFDRLREGPVSREIEPLPMDPTLVAMYRKGLRKFGIETECSNPSDSFRFTYIVKGGAKIPSFEMVMYMVSIVTLGIVPAKADMIVDMTYHHERAGRNVGSVNYLVPVTQWMSIFTIPKEISQNKEAREVYDISNYWDSIIVAKTASAILGELEIESTQSRRDAH